VDTEDGVAVYDRVQWRALLGQTRDLPLRKVQ
jgi:hypothetical protein